VSFRNARRAGEPFAFCGIPSLRDHRHRSVRFRSETVVISFSISLRAQDIVPGIRLRAGEREITRLRETTRQSTRKRTRERILYQSSRSRADGGGEEQEQGWVGNGLVPFGKWTFVICRGAMYKRVDSQRTTASFDLRRDMEYGIAGLRTSEFDISVLR